MKAAALRDDDETCRNMGFEAGSDGYKQCRLTTYTRTAQIARRWLRQPMLAGLEPIKPSKRPNRTIQVMSRRSISRGLMIDLGVRLPPDHRIRTHSKKPYPLIVLTANVTFATRCKVVPALIIKSWGPKGIATIAFAGAE